jgi:hypothetical protein
MLISVQGTDKNQKDSKGDSPVLSHFTLLRSSWPKSTGVLQIFRERETKYWFFIFRGFASYRIPKATNDVNALFFTYSSISCKLYKRITVKYTSEFR